VIWTLVAAAAQTGMAPINIPYQAQPAFIAYTECIRDRLNKDARVRSSDVSEVRQSDLDATAACREVRASELARGMAAVEDKRTIVAPPFRSRREAKAAVRRAFDRFDAEFEIE
jgi:hypothetical protein